MESFEAIRRTIAPLGVKAVAAAMNLSSSLLYKWSRPRDAGGVENPLDRIVKIYKTTGDKTPISWLCRQADGFLVCNTTIKKELDNAPILRITQSILKEFSEVLNAVSDSYEKDGEISLAEAEKIRKEWEELKEITESFVVACENGVYMGDKNRT